jgi:hypothetical protein
MSVPAIDGSGPPTRADRLVMLCSSDQQLIGRERDRTLEVQADET